MFQERHIHGFPLAELMKVATCHVFEVQEAAVVLMLGFQDIVKHIDCMQDINILLAATALLVTCKGRCYSTSDFDWICTNYGKGMFWFFTFR
jgi:hypothetical protein